MEARKNIEVVGHRGAAHYEPENTLRSFRRAIDMHADWIELDVRLTKDGQLVVMHDRTLSRTTNGRGPARQHTLDEIKKLKIKVKGGKPERVPTLEEVIDEFSGKVKFMIELKGRGTTTPVVELIKAKLEAKKLPLSIDDFILVSFHHNRISKAKRLLPEVQTGATISRINRKVDVQSIFRKTGADMLTIERQRVNGDITAAAHDLGKGIAVWTVDSRRKVLGLAEMGVDKIISNRPDMVLKALRREEHDAA